MADDWVTTSINGKPVSEEENWITTHIDDIPVYPFGLKGVTPTKGLPISAFQPARPVTKEPTPGGPLETFASAFAQSMVGKPAMMLRGVEVYTPGRGFGLDPLLEKASLTLQSLQRPEEMAKVEKAAMGKLWPTGEDRKWYQVESKYIPEVLNTWAANVGDQIPILLATFAGRRLGRIIGKPIGALAGAAAAMITAGPDPTDVATAPGVAAITSKIVEHLGGAAPLIAMEAGSFMDDANLLEIDKDISEKYARIYGLGSGAIEYAQQLWMLGRYKRLTRPAQKGILKEILIHLGGSAVEGLEEITQQGLENKLLQKASAEMKKRDPNYEVRKIDTWQGAKRAGIIATGVAAITTMPATTMTITQQQAKQHRERKALRLYDQQQENVIREEQVGDVVSVEDKEKAVVHLRRLAQVELALGNTEKAADFDQQAEDLYKETIEPEVLAPLNPEMLEKKPTSRQRTELHTKARNLEYDKEQRQSLYNELTGKNWEEFNQADAQIVIDYFDDQQRQTIQSEKIARSRLSDKEQKMLRGLSRTEDNFNTILDVISKNPLPENEDMREFLFDNYQTMADKIYKKSLKPNKPYVSWLMELQPIRNVLYEIEMKSGVNLYDSFRTAIYDASTAHQASINIVNRTLEEAGIKRRLATLPVNQNEHLRWWLHDPTDEVGLAAWENMDEKTRKIGTAMRELYQNEGKYRIGLLRFKLWSEYKKKPKSVKKDQAEAILEEGRKALEGENFKDWILKQDWVARENYYPSIRESQSLVDEIVTSLVPKDILTRFTKLQKMIPFEAYSREGKGSPIEGSVVQNTVNHFSRINTALLTMDNLTKFWKNFEGINPKQSDINIMREYVNNILGRGSKQGLPLRWAKKALRTFWRFYFINPFKGTWFFTRNVFQTPGYGATQLSWKEAAISMKDIVLRKGVEQRTEDRDLMWKAGISERAPVYQQWMMLEESKVRDPVRGYFANFAEEVGRIFIYSDEINRTLTWNPIHRAAQRNIEDLRSGKINLKQFNHRLKLDTLHPKQQIDLMNLLNEGMDREFVREIADFKTENIHFRYRTGLRSPAEQTLIGRMLVGLMVYPRGVFNLAWQNSIKPLHSGIVTGNYGKAYRGLANLIALYVGASLARRLLYKVAGKEAYGLVQTIFSYSPLAPGPAWLFERVNNFSWVVQEKGMSLATLNEAAKIGGDITEFLIPACDAYIDYYESQKDVKGVNFWNLMKKRLMKMYFHKTGKKYSRTDRDMWQKIAHVLFSGGFEMEKEGEKRKIF